MTYDIPTTYIYHAKSRLNTPVWGSLRSPNKPHPLPGLYLSEVAETGLHDGLEITKCWVTTRRHSVVHCSSVKLITASPSMIFNHIHHYKLEAVPTCPVKLAKRHFVLVSLRAFP